MDIPDHIWKDFDQFADEHGGDFYRVLVVGEEDEGTRTDEGCHIYKCIINRDMKRPTVSVGCRGKHTYYDWDTRQHGEIHETPSS